MYRVRQSFASLDAFTEGDVLRFERSSYSHYDAITGFDFTDAEGKSRRWDLSDAESLDFCDERFEVCTTE